MLSGCLVSFGKNGVIIFSIVHALYLLLFLWSLAILMRRLIRGTRSMWLTISTTLLFTSTSIVMGMVLTGSEMCVEISSMETAILTIVLALGTVLLADILIIHRCYIIWESRKVAIVIPTLLITTSLVLGTSVGICLLRLARTQDQNASVANLSHTSDILTSAFIASLFLTSFTATALSACRLWWLSRRVAREGARKTYTTIGIIILESGMLYCTAELIFLILQADTTYGSGDLDNVSGIVGIIVVETAGIASTLLIILSACHPLARVPPKKNPQVNVALTTQSSIVLDTVHP